MYLMERLQLKLSFSLATAFILVLAMLAGMIGYGLHHLATINRHLQYNTHGHNVVLDHVNTMRITARERTLILSRMIYLDDPFVLDELHMRFNALAGRFVRSREQLLKQHLDPVATALLAQQGRLTLSATTVQDQVLKLALNGEHDAARKLLSNQGIPAQDAVFNILNELYQVQEHEMLRATEEAGSAYHHARLLMVLIGSIAVVLGCLIALFVITQNRRYRAQLIREKTLAHTALHSIADAVITTDTKGNIEQINPQASEMLGLENQCVRGQPLMTLITLQNEDRSVSNINPIDETLHSARTVHSARPMLLVNRTGREHIIQYTVAPILEQGELYGSITVLHDVTELHSLNDQLQFHASHDALTGLINRREFERLLQQAVDNARKQGTTHALCYLDLDQFKIVNDTCGHLAGDELLKQLANHLRDELRAADVLARLGGDEFGVLLENCPLDVAETIADTLRLTVKEHRFTWDGKPFEIGVSIGIVPISADSGTLYDILRYADSACYMAKDLGRNCIKVFSLSSEGFVPPNEEIQWSQRIEQALENGHFCLHAEPIQSLQNSGSGHQHELLLRMQEDGENCIPPMAFIPAAERYNLMPQIDRWVISEAFRSFASEQQSIEKNNLLFTINISGQSLNDSTFVKFLEETLKGSTIDTSRVCFELSESAAITNLEAARKLIQTARKYGANFALDDFGTGFSSFSYLKNLPVNYVKIDGSFIRDIHDNPMDQLMVDSINRTCKLLHMQTIAEFVETETAFDTLQKMGIDYAQGWYLGNSRPLSEIYTAANQ